MISDNGRQDAGAPSDLARRMSIAGGISVRRARQLADVIAGVLRDGLLRDGEVALNGFGRWQLREGYRRTWNPRKVKKCGRGRRRVYFRGVEVR